MGVFHLRDIFRTTHRDDPSAPDSSFRPKIDKPVGKLYHVEIVLDQHQRVALLEKPVENFRQLPYVLEVETGRRLVQHIHLLPGFLSRQRQLARDLDALRFGAFVAVSDVSFEVKKVPPKSQVKVVWSGPSKKEISEEQKQITSGTGAVSFEMKDTAGLATGDYLVEFFSQDPGGAPEKWSSLGHKPFRVGPKQPS